MDYKRFAAIDIGSNAVRLLVNNVIENSLETPLFKKSTLIRVPVRLGNDAFLNHEISDTNVRKLLLTMHSFNNLMKVMDVIDFHACATSAMREARNASAIVERIYNEAGIKVKIIDGKTEAEIIFSTHIADTLSQKKNYLYVDVGGGSTEITLFARHQALSSRSFNIGTLRILNDLVKKSEWQAMKRWLRELRAEFKPLAIIGSGGNINKLFKLTRKKEGKPVTYSELSQQFDFLNSLTVEERIKILNLKVDRADVIVPASHIFLQIMKWSKSKRVFVPKIGLSDGIVHQVYEKHVKQERTSAGLN